ncbi:MAG: lamin tail domain-containing protein [Spirosomataceae bacterium]
MIRIIFCFLALSNLAYNTHAQSFSPLLITEVMPDPTPSRGLPEVEYVEIYNASQVPILVSDFIFVYQSTRVSLPPVLVPAQNYALLVRTDFTSLFASFPIQIIPLPRLSLTNTGALLQLVKAQTNEIVHEVQYAPDWGESYLKGGYSLEMIDERYPCVEKPNWRSSVSSKGGTPGQPNSVKASNPDVSSPVYLNYTWTKVENGETQLSLDINEKIDATQPGELLCDFGITKVSVSPSKKQIRATLTQEIPLSTPFTCQLKNWTDCSGNSMLDTSFVVGFFREPKPGEIVFSELLCNPYENGEKFVELMNISNEILSLKGIVLAQKDTKNEWDKGQEITSADWIIPPNGYVFLSKNKVKSAAPYLQKRIEMGIEMTRFPSMPQTEGYLGIFDSIGILLDEVRYSEEFHHPSLTSVKGVSLEKIRSEKSSMDSTNWLSATTLAGYATPGFANSQQEQPDSVHKERKVAWWLDSPVFSRTNPAFPQKITLHYDVEFPGNIAQIDVLRADGVFLQRLHTAILLGVSGEIEWDGTSVKGLETGHYFFNITYFDTRGGSQTALVKMVYVNE